jgi:hypothetical protein
MVASPRLIGAQEYANEYALQRAMVRQVSRLLRRAKNPRSLTTAPLMAAICRQTGTSNPVAALEQMVRTVFAGGDESAQRLRSAILEVDLKPGMTNAEQARRCGLSRRHFQRRRAEAVAALAQYARLVVTQCDADGQSFSGSALPQNTGPDGLRRQDSWRFERERVAFRHARDRSRVLEMRSVAGNLLRLAESRTERVLAAECRADANVRLGCGETIEHFEAMSPQARLLISAKLCLLAGNSEGAEERARVALGAFAREDRERYQCEAIVSQARQARGIAWRPPEETSSLSVFSWERVAMEVEQARGFVLEREWTAAERTADATLEHADEFGYLGLAARSAAVLHACATRRGDIAQAGSWRARAIAYALPTLDRVLASGLFLEDAFGERCGTDPLLGDVLYERLCLVVPQMQGESRTQRGAVAEALAALLDAACLPRERAPRLEAALCEVARADSALAHYARRLREPILDTMAFALAAMTGLSWERAHERLDATLADGTSLVTPGAPRAIPIAVPAHPQSQTVGAEHLRFDDAAAAGGGNATEGCADLRVRLLSLRSGAGTAFTRHGRDAAAGAPLEVISSADSR